MNVEYGGLFSRLGCKVLLRLHGVAYLYENLKRFKKYGIPSIEYFLGYRAPFKAVLCTKDSSPGYHFIHKFMRKSLKIFELLLIDGNHLLKSCSLCWRSLEWLKKRTNKVISKIMFYEDKVWPVYF